jgi:hypothetical protein
VEDRDAKGRGLGDDAAAGRHRAGGRPLLRQVRRHRIRDPSRARRQTRSVEENPWVAEVTAHSWLALGRLADAQKAFVALLDRFGDTAAASSHSVYRDLPNRSELAAAAAGPDAVRASIDEVKAQKRQVWRLDLWR